MPTRTSPSAIEVRSARTHNLKGVDCSIPHGRVTVVTGPSGAGKSSLAFDTVFAEGQRRYVESLSTYARQFLEQMERPPVDEISNLPPAVALAARNSVRNARATVGTLTEVHDVLRLLYTHLGEVLCPEGHGPARAYTAQQVADDLAAGAAGDRFLVVAAVDRPRRKAHDALRELVRQGFARRLAGDGSVGEIKRMSSRARWTTDIAPLRLVLGRYRASGEASTQLIAAVEDAFRLGHGRLEARGDEGDGMVRYYGERPGCATCGRLLRRPTPALFSFNTPLGACPECQGFGRVIGVDRERVVPDPGWTLEERPIAPWNTPAYEELYDKLFAACRARGVPLDIAWRDLPEEVREWVWTGDGDFTNLEAFFAWLERRSYKVHVRVLLARYRAYDPCRRCDGTRLRAEARAVRLAGKTLPDLTAMSIEDLRAWLAKRRWSKRDRARAGHLLDQLGERIEVLHRVGLDYLTLDRQARTLSGGESQRIHLGAALGSGLTSTLYVLDEPTVGLHPQDSERLVALLRDLAARGNTVLVVEHDRTVIRGADHVIDLGPAGGEHGGRVVAAGTLEELCAEPASVTAPYLVERPATPARRHQARYRRERGKASVEDEIRSRPRVGVRGARANNLKGFDVDFPLAALTAVTGVSGSGKSTLVESVIHANYHRDRGVVDVDPGACKALVGLHHVADVVLVDQRPLGRSARSNPVTYIKAYDEIRRLYAEVHEARRGRIGPGHFSFNVDRGRCPECRGTGTTEVDMHFMEPIRVPCDECQGRRFRPEVLAVRERGLNIAETLELTVDAARERYGGNRKLSRLLGALADVGLGYLRLGQSTATLSGGEAQRLKLASFLTRPPKGKPRLFMFDEPTTGLHPSDIEMLYKTLRKLVVRGEGVVVVEHNLDLVARADWVIDLGPGGGVHGGRLLYVGPLASFVDHPESPTAAELRRVPGVA